MKTALLKISQLKKYFRKRRAVDGLDLSIPHGAVVGFVGDNGAGKTTTMGIIAGLIHADQGKIELFGEGPYDPSQHKGRLTLLPQDARFHPHACVANVLRSCARLQGLSRRVAESETQRMLEWVNLSDRADSPVRTLSHGMIRRLTVAQAFLGNPDFIMLDEPTSGLDPQQVMQIRSLINDRRGQQAILISSHILSEIEAVCDEVAFVKEGRITRHEGLATITQQRKLVTYRIETGEVPLDRITDLLPRATANLTRQGTVLIVKVDGNSTLSTADINRLVLPLLLDAHVAILEVHSGTNLEQEYLKSFD